MRHCETRSNPFCFAGLLRRSSSQWRTDVAFARHCDREVRSGKQSRFAFVIARHEAIYSSLRGTKQSLLFTGLLRPRTSSSQWRVVVPPRNDGSRCWFSRHCEARSNLWSTTPNPLKGASQQSTGKSIHFFSNRQDKLYKINGQNRNGIFYFRAKS